MATGIRWSGLSRWKRENASNEQRVKRSLRDRGRTSGKLVADAAKSAFGGQMSGSDRKRMAGGDKLGVFSGRLKRSISASVTVSARGLRVEIGPTGKAAIYGTVHELGIDPFPARPFLGVAVTNTAEQVFRELGFVVKVIR